MNVPSDIFYSGSSNESQSSKDQVSTKQFESSTKTFEQNEMSPIIYLPVNQNDDYTNRYSNSYQNKVSNDRWSISNQNELSKMKWSAKRPNEMSFGELSPFEKVSEIKWSPNGAQISRYEISPMTVGEITTEVVQIPFRGADDISKSDLSSIELSKVEVSPERQDITINPISYVVVTIQLELRHL